MVTANDVDTTPAVVYNFSNQGNPDGMFSLDRYTGIIRLARRLDYETRKRYIVGLQASDGIHTKTTSQEVIVVDENDHAPMFVQQSYKVSGGLEITTNNNVHLIFLLYSILKNQNFLPSYGNSEQKSI